MSKVFFEPGFSSLSKHLSGYPQIFMVYDLSLESLADSLAEEFQIESCLGLNTSEETKTIETVLGIERFLLESGAGRNALLLAVGGGLLSDMAGFAASIYKRGIKFAIVPTTLLSMVDASIGGKTGVNLDSFKNMLGCFAMPEFTFTCTSVLETLPIREFLGGSAEMLKNFLIADSALYREAVRLLSRISASQYNTLGDIPERELPREELLHLIEASARIKMDIVERDPLEKGERRKLNLGHTFAHAIEWHQQTESHGRKRYSHGEAVAIGIILAAKLSEEKGLARSGLSAALADDFKACGLPTALSYPIDELEKAMAKDKKNTFPDKINYVLFRDIADIIF